jgi:hypothetical protein
VRRYIPLAAEGPRETAAAETVVQAPTTTVETPPAETTTGPESVAADLTGNGPPVGSNLGGGGSGGLESALQFVAGAALMLFLVLVTVKRRRAA